MSNVVPKRWQLFSDALLLTRRSFVTSLSVRSTELTMIALPLQRVDEATRNLIEQTLGAGNKIRDGVGEMLHPVKRVVVDVHEVFLASLRLFSVSNLRDSQPLCRCQLHVVHVGETVLVVANAPNLILHRCAVGMLQYERFAWHGEQAVDVAAVDDDGVVCCWQSSLC